MTESAKQCLTCRYWHPNPGQTEGLAFCTAQVGQTEAGFSCDGWREKGPIPIEEVLTGLANEIPAEEWEKLPEDLTDNLDHYVYGTPKVKE